MPAAELMRRCGLEPVGGEDVELTEIELDSRKVVPGSLFLAVKGGTTDGSRFVSEALRRGAAMVWSDSPIGAQDVPCLHVPQLREKLSGIANAYYGNPVKSVRCIGVTGTNGKSTVNKLMTALFSSQGSKVISLGTIDNSIAGETAPAKLTTPDPIEIIRWLYRGVSKGCDVLVMEVSSHALDQGRVNALPFARVVFTNLTQDHLDYHASFEEYYKAKKRLFSEFLAPDGAAIINRDSEYGRRLLSELSCKTFTFSQTDRSADVSLESSRLSLKGTELSIRYGGGTCHFHSNLIGKINLENLLAVIATGLSMDMDPGAIARGIAAVQVPGRNEKLSLPNGGTVLVDYAHTPDALERVLSSVKPLITGKLICVFGCGGDRDRAKRPMMGRAASANSDVLIVTSDNPRGEDPQNIILDIMEGVAASSSQVRADRKDAIETALAMCGTRDCVLIAGKGHEDYQIVGGQRKFFSDQKTVRDWIAARSVRGAVDGD